jgi:oligopeptide transport system permease protein
MSDINEIRDSHIEAPDFIPGDSPRTGLDTDQGSLADLEHRTAVGNPRSLWGDAWYGLRRTWYFWISAVLVVFIMLITVFPNWFADQEKTSSLSGGCNLMDSLMPPSSEHWFGTDQLGCDVYAMTIFGARPSVITAVVATLATVLLGAFIGVIAGYYGGWLDSVLSRITDVFFGLPILLGGIVILTALGSPGMWGVIFVLVVLGWVTTTRMIRSTTIEAKNQDFVLAARALGAGNGRIMVKHVLPNAMGPAIVVAVISLGGYVTAEATFSFLGLGIQPPQFSWGSIISEAQSVFFQAPWTLFFPALFLSATVLAFILLGEAVHDAIDPKSRK